MKKMAKNELKFKDNELKALYQIVKSFEEGLIENPSESWEMDYYEKPLVDRKPILTILKKIEKMLPKKEREGIIKDFLRRKYSTFNNEIDEKAYAVIEKAFDNLKTAEIGYFDMESAEVKKRLLDIYYKSRRYTIGHCHLKNAIRKFRTSRIAYAKITGKSYTIPSDFNKNNY